jgi:shikimate dehydrogenase
MKKFFVIGNPIQHSLSPELHSFWINENKVNASYEKKLLDKEGVQEIIKDVKNNSIEGLNVTVPYKNLVIQYLDELTPEAEKTQSVNTVFMRNKKTVGHNTDIAGFELAIRYAKYDVSGKKVLIIGAGGVTPSIIHALLKMNCNEIFIMNRTKEKAEEIKKIFTQIQVKNWGEKVDFDLIINTTSVGLKNDKLNLDLNVTNKMFFDLIYNPTKTPFLYNAEKFGNKIENGLMMFIYQAHQSFVMWNKVIPKIDDKIIKMLSK